MVPMLSADSLLVVLFVVGLNAGGGKAGIPGKGSYFADSLLGLLTFSFNSSSSVAL